MRKARKRYYIFWLGKCYSFLLSCNVSINKLFKTSNNFSLVFLIFIMRKMHYTQNLLRRVDERRGVLEKMSAYTSANCPGPARIFASAYRGGGRGFVGHTLPCVLNHRRRYHRHAVTTVFGPNCTSWVFSSESYRTMDTVV